jgi:hypothetical protein
MLRIIDVKRKGRDFIHMKVESFSRNLIVEQLLIINFC